MNGHLKVVKLLFATGNAHMNNVINTDGEPFVWLANHGFVEELKWLLPA